MRRHPLLLIPALFLGACTQTPAPTPSSGAYVLTVLHPDPALSDVALEARYSAHLVTRTPGFALLTQDAAPGLQAQALLPGTTREPNRRVMHAPLTATGTVNLWGSGTVALWGSGTVNLWGSGTVALWGSGSAQGPVANVTTWTALGLGEAHTRLGAGLNGSPGSGLTIAVLDTGLDLAHPMFAASLSPQSSWADLVDGDAVPQDEGTFGQGASGHGTAVAGLALLVAPGVKLMPVRVLDAGGLGDASAVAGGIVWAADHGADVINLSLGSDQLVEAVTQAVAYANSLGAVVVAAAGNAGREGLDFPAAQFGGSALNLAVGSHGALGLKSAFSQYGGLSLLAPGEGLMAPAPQNRVAAWSGTSMAAPVAAGAAALALAQGRTPQAAVSRLQATARNADAQNVLYAGKLGAGTLDLNRLTQPE